MPNFTITTTYPTEGPDAYVWGEPEAGLERALVAHGVQGIAHDYGTLLSTGDRDVWMEVAADSINQLQQAVSELPSSEQGLWKIEAVE